MNKMLIVSELSFILAGMEEMNKELVHFEVNPRSGVIGISCGPRTFKYNLWLSFGNTVEVESYLTAAYEYFPWELPADVSRRLHALMKDYHGEWVKEKAQEQEQVQE